MHSCKIFCFSRTDCKPVDFPNSLFMLDAMSLECSLKILFQERSPQASLERETKKVAQLHGECTVVRLDWKLNLKVSVG